MVPVVPVAGAGLRPAAGPRAPVVVPVGEAVEVPEVASAATRVADAGRRVRVGVRVAGVFDVGGTPGPTGGLSLAGALIGRRWRAELYGLWLAARTARPEPTLELGARVGLLAAGLRGCGVPAVGRVEFPLCGGLEAGGLRGAGSGSALVRRAEDTLPWLAVSAGPGLWWSPAPRVGLGLAFDVVVPLLPTRFRVAGYAEDVYTGARVAGRGLLAVELRF